MTFSPLSLRSVLAALALAAASTVAQAQLYVADHGGLGKLGVYDLPSGTAINPWVVDFSGPLGLAASATDLYVGSNNNGKVGKLNLATNSWNSSFINAPFADGVAFTGSSVLVGNSYDGSISKYDANTGALITADFISGVGSRAFVVSNGLLYDSGPGGLEVFDASTGALVNGSLFSGTALNAIAVSDSGIFTLNTGTYVISKYNTLSGALVSSTFIVPPSAGLSGPSNLLVSGNTLYVANDTFVATYDAVSGALLNSAFITGRQNPEAMAVGPIPEPSTYALLAGAGALGVALWRRRQAV